jgi:hypothetical protein
MNRRHILSLSVATALGLALLPGNAGQDWLRRASARRGEVPEILRNIDVRL